jgi:hypothetical protein
VIPGLALGLYAGRLLVEAFPRSFSPLLSVAVTLILVGAGISVAGMARRRAVRLAPLLFLWVYVVWPSASPLLALSVAFVVLVLCVGENVPRLSPWLADVLVAVAALGLYVSTLAPTILPADAGEFQLVSYVLGIAHPPGYPLYTMLAKLFTFIPLGDVAYRVNLFSAVSSALALVVLACAVRRMTGSYIAGWIAAAGLGLAPTFWAQSTTANIRSLTALFTALQMGALIAYAESSASEHLVTFALVLGLGITHHTSLVPLIVPYGAFLLVTVPELLRKPRAWLRPGLAFVLSLSVLVYLPLRSMMRPVFDPQPIRTLSSFFEHVLALGFRGDMLYFVQPTVLLSRIRVLGNILTFQFGTVWVVLGLWGALMMLLRRWRLLLLCGGVFMVNAALAVTYRAPQTVEYLMPAYVALALMCAYGAWVAYEWLRSRPRPLKALGTLFLAAVLLLPVLRLTHNWSSFAELSRDLSAREYAEGLLTQAPRDARILSNWHHATALWYLQYVEGVRPDVEVAYVYPQGAEPIAQTWVRRLEASSAERATLVTNQYPEFGTLSQSFHPFAGAWLVQAGPVFTAPPSAEPLDAVFDDLIRLVSYELSSTELSPADILTVRLHWQPTVKLDRDYSFFVHLIDGSGAPLGQGDTTHPATRYEVGQVISDEYRLPLLPTVRPGRYQLIAGIYITLDEGGWRRLTTADGRDAIVLGTVEVQPSHRVPATLHRLNRSFAAGYTLVGVDYDRSVAGQLRVYLHWRADREAPSAVGVTLFSGETPLNSDILPIIEQGSYVTTVHDLLAEATCLGVEVGEAQAPSAVLGLWNVNVGHRLSLPQAPADARYIPFGGEMVLVEAEHPAIAHASESMRARLVFMSAKAITHDYTVSLSLDGEGGAWRAQHDGTPALGAIPTLKWIWGITVEDEHLLPLPRDASGSGVLRLTVYDAFTVRPLPVLDERFARLGQGTQMDLGRVEIP